MIAVSIPKRCSNRSPQAVPLPPKGVRSDDGSETPARPGTPSLRASAISAKVVRFATTQSASPTPRSDRLCSAIKLMRSTSSRSARAIACRMAGPMIGNSASGKRLGFALHAQLHRPGKTCATSDAEAEAIHRAFDGFDLLLFRPDQDRTNRRKIVILCRRRDPGMGWLTVHARAEMLFRRIAAQSHRQLSEHGCQRGSSCFSARSSSTARFSRSATFHCVRRSSADPSMIQESVAAARAGFCSAVHLRSPAFVNVADVFFVITAQRFHRLQTLRTLGHQSLAQRFQFLPHKCIQRVITTTNFFSDLS